MGSFPLVLVLALFSVASCLQSSGRLGCPLSTSSVGERSPTNCRQFFCFLVNNGVRTALFGFGLCPTGQCFSVLEQCCITSQELGVRCPTLAG